MAQKKTNSKQTKKQTKKDTTKSKRRAAAPVQQNEVATLEPKRREIGGILFAGLSVFVFISYFTGEGAFIRWFADFLKGMVGFGYWLTAPLFLVLAYKLFFHNGRPVTLKIISGLMLPVFFSSLTNLFVYRGESSLSINALADYLFETGRNMESGGAIGGLLHIVLENAFSAYGAFFILLVLFVSALIILFEINLTGVKERVRTTATAQYKAPANDTAPAKKPAVIQLDANRQQTIGLPAVTDETAESITPLGSVLPRPQTAKKASQVKIEEFCFDVDTDAQFTSNQEAVIPLNGKTKATQKTKVRVRGNADGSPTDGVAPLSAAEAADIAGVQLDAAKPEEDAVFVELPRNSGKITPQVRKEVNKPAGKKVGKDEVAAEAEAFGKAAENSETVADYSFPPTSLLNYSAAASVDSRDEILDNQKRLNGALSSFGINAGIVSITHGPTVTRYDIELEQGVKLSKVTNLAGDLALALGVGNVRIAPIPEKIATVGIEVPNKRTSTVYLREILESQRFTGAKSKISFAIGKDIGGDCIVGNISKLPHLLIAGTTGSGKSVCMNSLILSLLYKARPDEVKLIMIDPKMVELGIYNGIPHLYVPVVTDPKKAAGALQWSVVEMLKRYRLFSEIGVRDLAAYNSYRERNGEQTLEQVVIVIDELADLMLVASKEVEESICRVAQMGRAAGMHLVIATQRPSADVITGLMKANIPSRIAFAVSSAMESRIILDQGGAEKLIGMGDMLYAPVGCGKPTRIQGAFVSDEERENVVNFIKEHAGAAQVQSSGELESFMKKAVEAKSSTAENGKETKPDSPAGDYDELLPEAVNAVLETKMCSVSMLQRRVKLGYSRAARIVDQMEELGVVGPHQGAKPREVLLDREGWQELAVSLGFAVDDDLAAAAEMNEELE